MPAKILRSKNRTVSVEELKARVSEFDLTSGIHLLTVASSKLLHGDFDDLQSIVNSFNLPNLSKAFVLWANLEGGKPLNAEELLELLTAVNSLPWYSKLSVDLGGDDAVLSMLVRQAFQRYYTDDPLDARIARTWMMFNEQVTYGGLDVDNPSDELAKLIGVSAEDLWMSGFMAWAFYSSITAIDGRKWIIDPKRFVLEGNNQEEIGALLDNVVKSLSLTPIEFRERYYAKDSKYRESNNREGYWISEFNILRDFPFLNIGNGRYTAPFPTYALTRVIDGFYYDLLNEFARRKLDSGAKDNPYDNAMNRTLGTLFERYVGQQLRSLPFEKNELSGEFSYGNRKQPKLGPDWILWRAGELPTIFECKAREAVLELQRYGSIEQLRTEVGKAIGKACTQMVRFIQEVDKKSAGLEKFFEQKEFICTVVLQAPLPFHMIPEIRQVIEEVARKMEPGWDQIRARIHFVPMSVRELETLVATELKCGIPVEKLLIDYANYRENARRVERWENKMPIFPRHLEEFLQENYNDGHRISNPLCTNAWEKFTAICQQRIFGEPIEVADQEIFQTIRQKAYELWQARGCPHGDDKTDWYQAERLLWEDLSILNIPN